MKFLQDKEINLRNEDYLNSKTYADTLKDVIKASPVDSSFSIGLYGQWGSGKSSIVKTATEELGKERSFKCIKYDAWKYTNDSFRRTFLIDLRNQLSFNNTQINLDELYRSTSNDNIISPKVNLIPLLFTGIIILILLAILYVNRNDQTNFQINAAIVISILALIANLFNRVLVDYRSTFSSAPVFSPEQFEIYFKQIVNRYFGENKKIEKLIVVVDNIDRCNKDAAYNLLSDLKTFLSDAPKIIYLVPIDEEALKRHLSKDEMEDGNKEAEEFLRKLFHTTLRIKPIKVYDLYNYASKLNKEYNLGLGNTSIDVIAKGLVTNPRRVKQFFNNLFIELSICNNLYGEDFVKEYESSICKLLFIKEEWPEFYNDLADNPNWLSWANNLLLERIKQKRDKNEYKNTESLSLYLTKTSSVTINNPISAIEQILTVSDRNKSIPNLVIDAVSSKDISKIQELLRDASVSKDVLSIYLVERLDKGLKESLYSTEVNNVLEVIFKLNKADDIDVEYNRRVYESIKDYVDPIIRNIEDVDVLCNYAIDMKIRLRNDYIDKYIIELIKNGLVNEHPGDYNLAKRLFMAFTREPINANRADIFSTQFALEYNRSKERLETYSFTPAVLQKIVTTTFVEQILNQISRFSDTDVYYQDLLLISNSFNFPSVSIGQIFGRYSVHRPALHNVPLGEIVEELKSLNKLFESSDGVIDDPFGTTMGAIYTLFSSNRTINSKSGNVLLEFISDEEKSVGIEFCLNVHRLGNGKLEVTELIRKLVSIPNHWGILYDQMQQLFEKKWIGLLAFKALIFEDIEYNESHTKLIGSLLSLSEKGEYMTSDEEIKQELERVIKTQINHPSPQLEKALWDWSSDERVKNILSICIQELSKDDLIRLPTHLIVLAFDRITDGNAIFDFEDNPDILMALGEKGASVHIEKLIKVVTRKLLNSDQVNLGLDLLESINELSSEQIDLIKGVIKGIDDEDLRSEGLVILRNKAISESQKYSDELNIIRAEYFSEHNKVSRNVTRIIRRLIKNGELELKVSNDLVPDKDIDHGKTKKLRVEYSINKAKFNQTVNEGEMLEIKSEKH